MLEDASFYFGHRLLHTPFLYKYIHKLHHEHKTIVGISAQTAHPIEFIFFNLVPVLIGPLALQSRMHHLTAFTWYALRFIESAEGHSGYEFTWSPFRLLPFGSDFAYHAYHHKYNIGNYSTFFTHWDTVFKTNKAYYAYLSDLREESENQKKVQ